MSNNHYLYQRDQVYRLDQKTIQLDAQPAQLLMQKAATATWNAIQQRWPECQHVVILAGAGNNGGDAFALAILAINQAKTVSLYMIGDTARQSTESAFYRDSFLQAGGEVLDWTGECPDCDVVVDGLLGIGLNKTLNDNWQSWITMINLKQAIRVSIDIPSGLNADTGMAMPCAIKADLTVSFIARKIGCWLADGPDYCGELLFDDLGISSAALSTETPLCTIMNNTNINLPIKRASNSHKNQFGHILVIGGDRGMPGAVRLAAMAALRAGAGMVSVCVHPDNYSAIAAADPELMVGVWDEVERLLERASVIVVGPGLGQSVNAKHLLDTVASCSKPMVIDAEALHSDFLARLLSDNKVITPHPGEAARLLKCSVPQIQHNRVQAIQYLIEHWTGACILKGSGSLVGQQDMPLSICHNGHSGLATAGSGDVLSGLVGAYLGQGLTALEAARCAAYVHALAAEDYAVDYHQDSLIASDLLRRIAAVHLKLNQSQGQGLAS
jgi:ADP-dependent NAD(P)H-hydrate dehydratase / NAD(P)H-hydrate epimerase